MRIRLLFLILLFSLIQTGAWAQTRTISGTVTDKQSDEPLPFVSVVLKKTGKGVTTDSAGKFALSLDKAIIDTIEISTIGYNTIRLPLTAFSDSLQTVIKLEVKPIADVVVIKSKSNRALNFWKKVIAHKDYNNRTKFDNYYYESYNKLELDLDNVHKEKMGKIGILKPFNFVLDYIDSTSEERPFLPVYLTETLSDYYSQKKPDRTREVIKAANTNGLDNESLIKNLGTTYQQINIYNNSIPVFDKTFINPFSDNGDKYYHFSLRDTQYLSGRRLIHFLFTPKSEGLNTFNGDCWIADTSFAIQKITMRPSGNANINYVTGLSIIQEYKLINDSTWFLYKDKFVADISPLGKKRISFKGRKTSTYRNVLVNDPSITAEIQKSRPVNDVILLNNTRNKPDSFWTQARHEPLNNNEKAVYQILDTLYRNKKFLFYRNTLDFLTTGTRYVGNYAIGPWANWVSSNLWEGTRLRFDLATNPSFSRTWHFHAYAAYGFGDRRFKGGGDAMYLFNRNAWTYLKVFYKKDIDNGQTSYDQLSSDNVFASFLRKPGTTPKYQQIEEKRIEYYKENYKGFGFGVTLSNRKFLPLLNLPDKDNFPAKDNEALNSSDVTFRLRYAHEEHTIESNFSRTSFGSDYPIVELRYKHGFNDILHSAYQYNRLDATVSDYIALSPYGSIYYNIFAGKVYGDALPYPLLALQPGNDWYYYSRGSFNLMNRFEFLTDRYAGFFVEHNIGSGLFRYTAFTRKLKLRQLWEVKGVAGTLNSANKALNFVPGSNFVSLDKKLYLEAGTGIDNIFKIFRIDAIWRLLPTPLPKDQTRRFGIFFGLHYGL